MNLNSNVIIIPGLGNDVANTNGLQTAGKNLVLFLTSLTRSGK